MDINDFSVTRKQELVKYHPEPSNSIRAIIIGLSRSGDVYENADLVGKKSKSEKIYQNAKNTKAEPCDENFYEDSGADVSSGSGKNKDGLLYAELMLDPPTTQNGKYVIRGIENHNEYAEIAYGKRGEPLPDSEKEKENSDNAKMCKPVNTKE